ncbi:MAG: hypothetical protein AAB861_03615 [Patescibacteria group bacterium]
MGRYKKRGLLLLFSIIVIYALWNARNLIQGPKLEIMEPKKGALITSRTLFVKGVAKNSSFIELNGRQIFTDKDGMFMEEILPQGGYNVLKMTAQDRFGKKTSEIIKFYYNDLNNF